MKKLLILFFMMMGLVFQNINSLAKDKKMNEKEMLQLAYLYYINEEYEMTEKIFKKVSDNGSVIAKALLGTFYNEQKKYDLAEKYWKLASVQGNEDARLKLGMTYYKQGKRDLSIKYFKLAKDENNSEIAKGALEDLFNIK